MHDELFEQPAVVARYRAGPYTESRERFLRQARVDGYSRATLESMAWALLVVAFMVPPLVCAAVMAVAYEVTVLP